MSVFRAPQFHDEGAARLFVEAHLWPDGPVCPHCGACDRIIELKGKATKPGTRKCGRCRKLFSVTKGTVFESSHVPLHKWLVALYLICSSKKGVSSHQLHRTLGVTLKTAWFVSHRVREAMRDGSLGSLGGAGDTVEADETYLGPKSGEAKRAKHTRGPGGKRAVVGLVQRGDKVRTFHVDRADKDTVGSIVRYHVARESALMTDESRLYVEVGAEMASHETVIDSADEYVRGAVHTNTIEGYLGIFKRGMKGVYQHCAEKHLHRYLAEFDFRYNNRVALGVGDGVRAALALVGSKGKRLTYRELVAGRRLMLREGKAAMDRVIKLSISGKGADTDAPTVDDLLDQVRDYFAVMREVEKTMAADGVNAIDWRVVSASSNSPIELAIAPFPREYAVNIDDRADATVETAARGFQILQDRAEDPPFFSDKAIQTAEKFFSRVMNGLS